MQSVQNPIIILPGVEPSTDNTGVATEHYTDADKIRFVGGKPEKIGGWQLLTLEYNTTILGCCRNIYSFVLDNIVRYILGTNTSLYSIIASQHINITPVETTADALTDPFATNYGTLSNNPIATTVGTGNITVTDTAHKLRVGDPVKLSGASTTNGITNTLLNATHTITAVTTDTYSFVVNGTASSTGSGGGASVVRSTKIISVTHATHGYSEGWNIEVDGATETGNNIGGIPIAEVNAPHQIRNVTTNAYDIICSTFATSSVSSQGNAVDIYPQIAEGACDSTIGQGYGMGRYGVGAYGVSKVGSTPTQPRIWSFDRFGDFVLLTPGNQTGVYSWDGSTSTLPALVSGAPTAVNYVFVTDNIVVTLGASDVANRIKWSDQGGLTTWTATAENQAGEDDIEGADRFISHAGLKGINLIYTRSKVYTFRYIKKPLVFETKLLEDKDGLIAQNARIVIGGTAYWMGNNNFYYYRGGNVEVIPSNSGYETTLKEYIFGNLNVAQKDKIFCWYNPKFNEIWWHYPSEDAEEPNKVARLNIKDFTWTPDTFERTAAEYPIVHQVYPYLADHDGNIYLHENGYNEGEEPMAFTLKSPVFNIDINVTAITGLLPDNILTDETSLEVNIYLKKYPQSTPVLLAASPQEVTSATEILVFKSSARFWQYEITGEELGQFWRAGQWFEEIQKAGGK